MVFPVSTMALGKGRAKERGEMSREGRLSGAKYADSGIKKKTFTNYINILTKN